jgi:Protein of unknown function (DUF732)
MKKLLAVAAAAIALAAAPTASADSTAYFAALDDQGMITWDYPGVLQQGYIVCDMLWDNVNPMGWLTTWVGYDAPSAASIITAARMGLCPGNAVTAPPPQLKYAV